jgi:hypothetical protein
MERTFMNRGSDTVCGEMPGILMIAAALASEIGPRMGADLVAGQ